MPNGWPQCSRRHLASAAYPVPAAPRSSAQHRVEQRPARPQRRAGDGERSGRGELLCLEHVRFAGAGAVRSGVHVSDPDRQVPRGRGASAAGRREIITPSLVAAPGAVGGPELTHGGPRVRIECLGWQLLAAADDKQRVERAGLVAHVVDQLEDAVPVVVSPDAVEQRHHVRRAASAPQPPRQPPVGPPQVLQECVHHQLEDLRLIFLVADSDGQPLGETDEGSRVTRGEVRLTQEPPVVGPEDRQPAARLRREPERRDAAQQRQRRFDPPRRRNVAAQFVLDLVADAGEPALRQRSFPQPPQQHPVRLQRRTPHVLRQQPVRQAEPAEPDAARPGVASAAEFRGQFEQD